jgi:hypothetical protein
MTEEGASLSSLRQWVQCPSPLLHFFDRHQCDLNRMHLWRIALLRRIRVERRAERWASSVMASPAEAVKQALWSSPGVRTGCKAGRRFGGCLVLASTAPGRAARDEGWLRDDRVSLGRAGARTRRARSFGRPRRRARRGAGVQGEAGFGKARLSLDRGSQQVVSVEGCSGQLTKADGIWVRPLRRPGTRSAERG